MTLAIGDGANDVPMLIAAHVGVGIAGVEGMQAVQASDFSISQFRFLVPLMLYHGKEGYRRTSFFLLTFLYKQWALFWPIAVLFHLNKFDPVKTLPEFVMVLLPTLSSFPPYILAILDKETTYKDAIRNPGLYKRGPKRDHFNPRVFISWSLLAFYQGVTSWLLPHFLLCDGDCDYGTQNFWIIRFVSFNAINFIVFLEIGAATYRRSWILAFFVGVSTVIAFMMVLYGPILITGKDEAEVDIGRDTMYVAKYSELALFDRTPLLSTLITVVVGMFWKVVVLIAKKINGPGVTPLSTSEFELAANENNDHINLLAKGR